MEIKGLDEFLKGEKAINLKDVIEEAHSKGYSLNNIAKSLILSLQEIKHPKYLEVKNAYLNDAVKKAEEETIKNYDNKKLQYLKEYHELELEIIKAKLETVNKKLEG